MQCKAHLSKIGQQNYTMTVRLPQYRLTVHTYAFVTVLTTVFAYLFLSDLVIWLLLQTST